MQFCKAQDLWQQEWRIAITSSPDFDKRPFDLLKLGSLEKIVKIRAMEKFKNQVELVEGKTHIHL